MRWKIRAANLRRLLTFTNGAQGDGWQTLRLALLDVVEWYKADGHWLGNTPIVLVAERGKGGRVHVHAAIRAGYRLEYRQIIASWSAFMEGKGHHSETGSHRWHSGDEQGKGKKFSSARVCANYMSKYLSKGFEEEERDLFEKRYRAAGVVLPDPRRLTGFAMSEALAILSDTFEGLCDVEPYISPDGDYGGWWFEVTA